MVELHCGKRILKMTDSPAVMGILNVTPDSFSDGGKYIDATAAVEHALSMCRDGADIIDIGGESTRPGAPECPPEIEIGRVLPVVQALRAVSDIIISVDTRHAATAEAVLSAGADIINDVSGGIFDPSILSVTARFKAGYVLMHSRGIPETMQSESLCGYDDLHNEIIQFLAAQTAKAEKAGIARNAIVLDPGIGFAKTADQNIAVMQNLPRYAAAFPGMALLIGHSRKSFMTKFGLAPGNRDSMTHALSCYFSTLGLPLILRVHDVAGTKTASQTWETP